jgi:hypothetical protein
MEARFGPPGAGRRELRIGRTVYGLAEAMVRLGIDFEGCRTIDGFELGHGHFAVRYYDPDERRVVVYEFDDRFRYLGETRVDIAEWAEWTGEDALALDGPAGSGPPWT